jgi:hypothetical protein
MMGRIEVPSELELDMLLSYLQQHAQKPIGQELRGTLETKAGHAFQSIYSQCHAQPDPKQHSAREWPAVVGRMKAHETTLGKLVPDEAKPGIHRFPASVCADCKVIPAALCCWLLQL